MTASIAKDAELKDNLLGIKDVTTFLNEAWESSIKNSAARNYMAGLIDSLRWAGRISGEEHDTAYDTYVYGKEEQSMTASLVGTLAKTARILCEDEEVNADSTLQAMVGDPADARTSTFVQFQPNPGTMQLPNPDSPIQGDDIFFSYLIPGAIFQDKSGSEWWILTYTAPDEIEIENRWYPRVNAIVSINDIRRSIHQWVEPVTQIVPPPPPGVTYGALPVRIVNDEQGEVDKAETNFGSSLTGGW